MTDLLKQVKVSQKVQKDLTPLEIKNRGVTLQTLLDLKDKYGCGNEVGEGVVKKHVKRVTKSKLCSYAELMRNKKDSNGRPCVGPVQYFISHAWRYKFNDLLAAVRRFDEKLDQPGYYFNDYVAINQHNPMGDLGELEHMVQISKAVVLVLSPWDKPIPLTRAWCVFEIWKCIHYKTPLEISMPDKDVAGFKDGLVNDFLKVVDAISSVDAETAEASVKSDEIMIKDAIRESQGGFSNVNKIVIGELKIWLRETAIKIAETTKNMGEQGELYYWIGKLFQEEQKWADAQAVWKKSRDLFAKHYNDDLCEKALRSNTRVAQSMGYQKGQMNASFKLQKQNWEHQRKILGHDHLDTLWTQTNVATKMRCKKLYNEALQLQIEAVEKYKKLLGEKSFQYIESTGQLGFIYSKMQDHKTAEKWRGLSCRLAEKHLGPRNPETLKAMTNLSITLGKLGRDLEAVQYKRKILDLRKEILGDEHPLTLRAMNNLAFSQKKLGKFDAALKLYLDCLTLKVKVMGTDGRDTKTTLNNIPPLLKVMGRAADYDKLIGPIMAKGSKRTF